MSLAHETAPRTAANLLRHDWTREEVRALFALPFPELMFRAALVHRENFDPTEVQISTLLSIKTGGCPEDCAYCPQAAQYDTGVKAEKLMSLDAVLSEARAAKAGGASRFCMGAAWRCAEGPRSRFRLRHGGGRQGLGAGDLRHARHADGRAGGAAEGLRPRLLQPQPRYLAGILRRHHHHAHLPGSPRHARPRAQCRHPCLLRRHRRHGRGARGPRRHDRDAGEPAGASGERADQHAGAGGRHAARSAQPSSIRSISCAPSRWRASRCRLRWCGFRPAART